MAIAASSSESSSRSGTTNTPQEADNEELNNRVGDLRAVITVANESAVAPGPLLVSMDPVDAELRNKSGLCSSATLFLSQGDFSSHISRSVDLKKKNDKEDTEMQKSIDKELGKVKWWFALGKTEPVRVTFNGFLETGGEKYFLHDLEDVKKLLRRKNLSEFNASEVQEEVLKNLRKLESLTRPLIGNRKASRFVQSYLGKMQPLFPHLSDTEDYLNFSLGSKNRLTELEVTEEQRTEVKDNLKEVKKLKKKANKQLISKKKDRKTLLENNGSEQEIDKVEEEILKLREIERASDTLIQFVLLEFARKGDLTEEALGEIVTDYNKLSGVKEGKKSDAQEVAAIILHIQESRSTQIADFTQGKYGIPKGEKWLIQGALGKPISDPFINSLFASNT